MTGTRDCGNAGLRERGIAGTRDCGNAERRTNDLERRHRVPPFPRSPVPVSSFQRAVLAMRQALIVSAVRTPVGRAPRGTLKDTPPDEIAAAVIADAVRPAPGLDSGEVDDVVLGCALPW